jgi:hypothetical protein
MEACPRYLVTMVSTNCKAETFGKVTRLISDAGLNLDNITRLSRVVSLSGPSWGRGHKRFALQLEVSSRDSPAIANAKVRGFRGSVSCEPCIFGFRV